MTILTRFARPLIVDKRDNYTTTLDPDYLKSDLIVSATVVVVGDPLVTVEQVTVTGNVISAMCLGLAGGETKLKFSWVLTSTRSRCKKYIIVVEDC